MVIFPLAPDQTIAQMWSNGARGGGAFLEHGVYVTSKLETDDNRNYAECLQSVFKLCLQVLNNLAQ